MCCVCPELAAFPIPCNSGQELLLFLLFPLVLCCERQFLKLSVLFSIIIIKKHILALVDS